MRFSNLVTCVSSPYWDSYSWKNVKSGLAFAMVSALLVSLLTVVSNTARASGSVS